MLAVDPNSTNRHDRSSCPTCGATAGGCQGLHWLGGRYCCAECTGDHDATAATPAASSGEGKR